MCKFTHTHIHTHTHTHMHMYACTFTYTCACTHVCTCTHICTYMHTNNIRKFKVRTTKESTKTLPKEFWCLKALTINKWHGIVDKFNPV